MTVRFNKSIMDPKTRWEKDDMATFEAIEEVCNVGSRLYEESKRKANRK